MGGRARLHRLPRHLPQKMEGGCQTQAEIPLEEGEATLPEVRSLLLWAGRERDCLLAAGHWARANLVGVMA